MGSFTEVPDVVIGGCVLIHVFWYILDSCVEEIWVMADFLLELVEDILLKISRPLPKRFRPDLEESLAKIPVDLLKQRLFICESLRAMVIP